MDETKEISNETWAQESAYNDKLKDEEKIVNKQGQWLPIVGIVVTISPSFSL